MKQNKGENPQIFKLFFGNAMEFEGFWEEVDQVCS